MLWNIIEEAFDYSIKAHEKVGGRSIPKDDSLQDFIRGRAELELDDADERTILLQMSEMWGAYVGEPIWKQSLRFAWMEECCGGGKFMSPYLRRLDLLTRTVKEEMFVASNYSAILERIAKPAQVQANIRLGTKVVSIQSPQERSSGKRSIVTTTDGLKLEFDEVIMTAPLGWLQRNLDCFRPSLPTRLESAIHNLKLSQLEKVFITFPTAFWISDKTGDSFPSYTNWLSPQYAADTNPHAWPQEIWNLASFNKPDNHPTILFYLYGDCSRHIVNSIYDKTKPEKDAFVNKFFRPYYSRLPGYDPNNPDCTPQAILASEWLKDELSGYGSYCNFQVGVEEADKDVETIRAGCPDRKLWFCGEHAAPFEECGTVTGAYMSGESVGQRIVKLYGLSQ